MTTPPRPFNNKELLKIIRQEVINPLVEESGATKLKANLLEQNLTRFQYDLARWIVKTGKAYRATAVDGPAKELVVTDIDGGQHRINLAPMFDSIIDDKGVKVETDRLTPSLVQTLHFQGTGVGVSLDPNDPEKALITINKGGGGSGGGTPITATIHGQGSSEIDAINITGATPGTSIDGSQLNLHLPDGRFEGFAESMTDLNKLSTASEVNQSFSYLKVTNSYGGKGWVPMVFSREPGQQASWKNFKHLSHLSFVGRNDEGILQNQGFISSVTNNGVTDLVGEALTVRDTRIEAFKRDETTETKTPLGEIGQISFRGVSDSDVTTTTIPNDPHNRKELIINTGFNLKGTIDTSPVKPKNINTISLKNASGGSKITDTGTMVIDLADNSQTAQIKKEDGTWANKELYYNTQIDGNIGSSQVSNEVLSLNIPYLKVGKKAEAAFDQTHRSYAWKQPFDKWNDDLQWNPIKEGLEKKWEDDTSWSDGKPWSIFSDTPVHDASALHFEGNVEVVNDSSKKVTSIKVPFLRGQVETTGSENDVSKIVFPKGSTIQDSTLTIAPYPESVKTELDVEVDVRPGQIAEAGVHKIHAIGKYARIDKETASDSSVEKYILGIDTHPYAQIKLGDNPFDAYFIQGSQEDFNHKTVNISGDDDNPDYKDIVEVTGFNRFPKTFSGDGTPDFDIDGDLKETKFVFLKKGANSVKQGSPSKDVVAKGGWVMNLYTGNPTGLQEHDNTSQIFYPLDGSDIKYRSGGSDSVGAKEWTDIGGGKGGRLKGFFSDKDSLPTSGVIVNESYAYVFTSKKTDTDTSDNKTPTMFRYISEGGVNKWVEDAPKGTFVLDIDDKDIEDKIIERIRVSGGGTGVKVESDNTLVFDFGQLQISSAENFPEVFESTGTTDYDIDSPGKKSRYVFIKKGTQSDNILNYQYLDPEEKWFDFHRYNSLSEESPSKNLVLKGGWVLNLYTDKDPADSASEELFHQTFYPIDGSPPSYRASSYGSLATTDWVELGSSSDFKGFFDKVSDLPKKGNVDNQSYCYVLTKQVSGSRYRAVPQMYRWYNGGWSQDYVKGVLIASGGTSTNVPINEIKVTGSSKKITITGGTLDIGINELVVEANDYASLNNEYPATDYKGTFGLVQYPLNHEGGTVIKVSNGKEWGSIASKAQDFYKEKLGGLWTGEMVLPFRDSYPHRLCKVEKPSGSEGTVIAGDDGSYVSRFEEGTGFYWIKPDETSPALGRPLTAIESDGFYLHSMVQKIKPEGTTWSETVAHTDAIWTQVLYGASSGRVWTRTKAKGVTTRPVWSELESSSSKFERFPRIFPLTGTVDDGSSTVVNIEQPKRKSRFIYIPANTIPSGMSDMDWEEPDDDWNDDNLYNAIVAGASGSEELLKKGGWVLCLYSGPISGTDGAKISQIFYPQDGSAPKFRASDYATLSTTPWKNFTGGSKDTGHIIGKVGGTDESEIQKIEFDSKYATIIDGVLKVPAIEALNESDAIIGQIGNLKAGSGIELAKEVKNNQETGSILVSLKDTSVKGNLTVTGKDWDSSAIPSTSHTNVNQETTKIEFSDEMDVNVITEGEAGSQTTYVKVGLKNSGLLAATALPDSSGKDTYKVIEQIKVIGETTETAISDKKLEINVKPPVEISDDEELGDFTTNYPPSKHKGRLALVEPINGMYVSNGSNWYPLSNFSGLTRKHYSILIPRNDTQVDTVIAASKLNYQIVQDPEANIKANGGKFQILQSGNYDISCMFQMSNDGVNLRGKTFTVELELHTNDSGTYQSKLVAEVTYNSTGMGDAKLFSFKNVALTAGVNFFIKPNVTKKSGSDTPQWDTGTELDPYKNFIVVEQANSLTKTGLNIAKTLRDTLGGLSFRNNSEVRVVPKVGTDGQYVIKAEAYSDNFQVITQ